MLKLESIIYHIERHFKELKSELSSFSASRIRELIEANKVKWDELTFTEADLEREEQRANIRHVEHYFEKLKSTTGSFFANRIRELIEANEVKWGELSFTEAELEQEERKAQVRAA